MNPIADVLPDVSQPREAGMRRFCDRSRDIEVEDRLRGPRPPFCQPAPVRITPAGGGISANAVPNEIDVRMFLISRPVLLEVVEE